MGLDVPISQRIAGRFESFVDMFGHPMLRSNGDDGWLHQGWRAAFPLAATVAASAISAWIVPQRARLTRNFTDQAIISIGVVGLFGLLFIGRYFGRLSAGKELSILLAPLLCWVSEIPLVRRRRPWIVGSLRLAMVAIPLVMVLGAAKKEFDRDMAPLLGRVSRAATRVHDTPRLAVCIRNCD